MLALSNKPTRSPRTWTVPPGAEREPVLVTVPPNKVRFSSEPTTKSPALIIAADSSPSNCKPMVTGTSIVNRGAAWGSVALN